MTGSGCVIGLDPLVEGRTQVTATSLDQLSAKANQERANCLPQLGRNSATLHRSDATRPRRREIKRGIRDATRVHQTFRRRGGSLAVRRACPASAAAEHW